MAKPKSALLMPYIDAIEYEKAIGSTWADLLPAVRTAGIDTRDAVALRQTFARSKKRRERVNVEIPQKPLPATGPATPKSSAKPAPQEQRSSNDDLDFGFDDD